MEANEILAKARANDEKPAGWIVFPLLRNKVIYSIIGWIFGTLLGLALLAFTAPVVIPHNYQQGVAAAIFTTLLLIIFLFVGVGSFILLLGDIQRLRFPHKHVIVITNEDFVKQEGEQIILIPLEYVRHVTTRGKAPIDREPAPAMSETNPLPRAGENLFSFFLGSGLTSAGMNWRRKRMRTPTSLAFIDARTNQEVTVVNDASYGDPFLIAAILKQYTLPIS